MDQDANPSICKEDEPADHERSGAVEIDKPNRALKELKDGNLTFKKSKCLCIAIDRTPDPDCKVQQRPIAVIVGCSDSRVPPELVFSQGLGELFVIRSAGNTIDAAAMGSLEYAVQDLEAPLIVVMGHQCCGAVDAAFKAWKCGKDYPGSMSAFVEPIIPAVIDAAIANERSPDRIPDASITANVTRIVKRLRESSEPMLLSRIRRGTLRVVGARYNFDGFVDFFDEGSVVSPDPPMQTAGPAQVA